MSTSRIARGRKTQRLVAALGSELAYRLLIDQMATIWSGAPWPSPRSRSKAEEVLEHLLDLDWTPPEANA